MLTISSKGIYGLEAILELTRRYNQGPVQIKMIAEEHKIPQHYLEQILVILKKNQLVKSFRGQQGGYVLAKNPGEIRVIDVLQALEGELKLISDQHNEDVLAFFWKNTEKAISKVFSLTLLELRNMEQSQNQVINFII